MYYQLYISPCPNDTFAFYALIHSLIDTEGVNFDLHFEDIETLNSIALAGSADIVKASIAVAPLIDYQLLTAGAALGRGNGPVVVRQVRPAENPAACEAPKTAILPGAHTTAALLFTRYFKEYTPTYALFSTIAPAIARGEATLGTLIHEGRFTYADYGLEQVADLGMLWENETGRPLPLGGIFARRELDGAKLSRIISRSVSWALANRTAPLDFVKSHAAELSPEVMQQHIDLFVNDYTVDLGDDGRSAIELLLTK